jgi:beta-galactosidase
MRRSPLNSGWEVRPKGERFAERIGLGVEWSPVTLPHDAMIGSPRSPSATAASGYFRGGSWLYRRSLELPERGSDAAWLEFEAIYRDAFVFLNDTLVAHRPSGYTDFVIEIGHVLGSDTPNEVRVEVRAHEDSRWYSGAGIYRNVWLLQAPPVHLAPRGIQVLTPMIDDAVAALDVTAIVQNQSTSASRAVVRIEVVDAEGIGVAQTESPVTTVPGETLKARQRLFVERPLRWSCDSPYLYTCRATLLEDNELIDEEFTTFGIRSITLDPMRGLRINGENVLLRGACIHHDNGVLGAATIDRAEERRVALLKSAGFNAIRSAHNPMSRAMLDACDRLGMLVMDEAFDMWTRPKSPDDYALRFSKWWDADLEAMVLKDINHPSVIFYSIGNEIPEAGTPDGARCGRALADKVRSLDSTRFVTEAVTGMFLAGEALFAGVQSASPDGLDHNEEREINLDMSNVADVFRELMKLPVIAEKSVETLSFLDVAGYNYMESRFEIDCELFPGRAIVATETHPAAIASGWAGVKQYPQVIGDFTWTGWDYLGEAGIGRVEYGEPTQSASFTGGYPWLTAWCGDIDITGHRRPQSYYREIVFGLRSDPYIAVLRPEHFGRVGHCTPWSWDDVVSSWTWDGHEGAPVEVQVYADADEVELFVNGRSLGRKPTGSAVQFRTQFNAVFEPGHLEAVAFRRSEEIGRTSMTSASGPVLIELRLDRRQITNSTNDLAFVEIALVDQDGRLYTCADREILADVRGPGTLQGFGSANPLNEHPFTSSRSRTFDGLALAVVRPTGRGTIRLTVSADGCMPMSVDIDVS